VSDRSRLEVVTWTLLLVGIGVFFLNYVLGGLDGVAYAWYEAQQAALDFVSWRLDVYALVLAPTIAVVAYLLRHALPIIEIPVLGAGNLEARVIRKWYWPGSFRIEDAEASWREGRWRGFVNKALIARTGFLGYLIVQPVERNVSEADREVTYDTATVPAYTSRTLHRRLQREAQERIVQDHRSLREKVQP
jgi:hypothetical protein